MLLCVFCPPSSRFFGSHFFVSCWHKQPLFIATMPIDFTNGANQENLPCCGYDDCSDCCLMKGLGGAFIHAKGLGQVWVHTQDVLLDADKDDKGNRSEKSRTNPLEIFGCCCCAFTHLTFGFGSNHNLRTACAVLLPVWIILWLVAFFFDSLFFILLLPLPSPSPWLPCGSTRSFVPVIETMISKKESGPPLTTVPVSVSRTRLEAHPET